MLLAAALVCASAGLAHGQASFKVPSFGGAVMTPDNKTLIVSSPASGSLVYFDTLAGKELKRVEMDFQPAALAIQGKKLFVAAKGASVVHVVDADSGKDVKEISTSGAPVQWLACHPEKGLVYASNANFDVFAINPDTGKAVLTKAKGGFLAMDTIEGKYLYTGIQKPIRDVLVVTPGAGKSMKLSLGRANRSAFLLKWSVVGSDLLLVDANDNAAINGVSMAVSPDGKRIAMCGAGGWSPAQGGGRTYGIAVYKTTDMKALAGIIETGAYPRIVAFHPVLNLGAAGRYGGADEIILFNAKSLIKKGEPFRMERGHMPAFVTFGAQGARLIYVSTPGPGKAEATINMVPLTLTEQDRETLKKSFGS
jgi:hypothetical protein